MNEYDVSEAIIEKQKPAWEIWRLSLASVNREMP
jgi:frataxin-like iron-binding protein CyaY